jgi:hypothetical protein
LTTDICDDNGAVYDTDTNWKEYIANFFQNLYRNNASVEGNIEDFLGETILSSPTVQASKLTAEEKSELDKLLSIKELDLSIKGSNKKSAPGVDGFCNKFISKFREFFRVPHLTV